MVVKLAGITLVFLIIGLNSASAKPLPYDRQLSELVASLDSVLVTGCDGPVCTKDRSAHKKRIRRWRDEMNTAVKNGHAGCAVLRSRQRGEWKLTGFWCEGDVYSKVPDAPSSTGEPEWVVLR